MLNLKIKHEKQELYEIYFFRLTLAFCFPDNSLEVSFTW